MAPTTIEPAEASSESGDSNAAPVYGSRDRIVIDEMDTDLDALVDAASREGEDQ